MPTREFCESRIQRNYCALEVLTEVLSIANERRVIDRCNELKSKFERSNDYYRQELQNKAPPVNTDEA